MAEGKGYGKCILFNEHFVVYGISSIVSAIGDATVATVEKTESGGIQLVDNRPADTATLDLYYALTKVDPQRVHITLTIDDFDCITEVRRYVFYNKGDNPVSLLQLPARERKTQRNMKVEDASNRDLVFIPSFSSADLLVGACATILEKSSTYLDEPQKTVFQNIRESVEPGLIKVFTYKPDPTDIASVCSIIEAIPKMEIPKSKEFSREILPLVELLEQYNNGLYYPLVALSEPLEPRNYTQVTLSVERLREYLRNKWDRFITLLKFGLSGRFTFSYEPELHPGISNHVGIYAPEGLLIRDVEFDLLANPRDSDDVKNLTQALKKNLNEEKMENFDERCFYVQLGPTESTIMCNCTTRFNIMFGLSKKGFHLGLLPLLCLFLWLTIISPLFFDALISTQFILMLLTLSVTILVAIGIYAIDKKIVNHYIITQVSIVFLAFVVEILYLIVKY